MRRAKKSRSQPRTRPEPRPAVVNGPPGEVLTLAEAAAYLRLSEQEVLRLIQEQGLPARQAGTDWRFLRAAIQQWLSTPSESLQSNKEAWLALAGAWKDDPYVEDELKEIYRRRRSR
jgi:excisionase family DNA binding protein